MKSFCQIRFEALDAYQYGMMNLAQRKQLQEHICGCEECRERLQQLATESMEIGIALRSVDRPKSGLQPRDLISLHLKQQQEAAGTRRKGLERAGTLVVQATSRALHWAGRRLGASWNYARREPWVRRAALAGTACMAVVLGVFLTVTHQHERQRDLMTQVEARFWKTQHEHLLALAQMNERLREEVDRRLLEQRSLNSEIQRQLQKEQLQAFIGIQSELKRLSEELAQRQQQVAELAQKLDVERNGLKDLLKGQQEELADLATRLNEGMKSVAVATPPPAAVRPAPEPSLQLIPDDGVNLAWSSGQSGDIVPLTKNGVRLGWIRRMTSAAALVNAIPAGDGGDALQRIVAQVPRVLNHESVSLVGPAARKGLVFTGSGWGNNQVLALNSTTGEEVWSYTADDNGIGPVVVTDDGYVSFSTESCTVYVLDAKNGGERWSRYLANHAMTQPAIHGSRMYVVHPSGDGTGVRPSSNSPYSLTCLNMANGRVIWASGTSDDAITSPVIQGDRVYLTTRDGNVSIFSAKDGKSLWEQKANATSAPTVNDGRLYVSSWQRSPTGSFEERLLEFSKGTDSDPVRELWGPFAAPYLLPMLPAHMTLDDVYDSSDFDLRERFLQVAMSNRPSTPVLPHVWQHMGARPLVVGERLYAMVGNRLGAVDIRTGQTLWSLGVSGNAQRTIDIGSGQAPLTPPSYADGKLYMGSLWGDLVCIEADSGKLLWRHRLANSLGITSQIVLDSGRMYASTRDGLLVSIDTGDPDATGWNTWGGTADHNSYIPEARPIVQPEEPTVRL